MRVLVAGGAGYIGSVVTAALLAEGHEVTVLDDLSTGHADAVPPGARFVEASLHDSGPVLADVRPEAVLHFAAKSLVGASQQQPEDYWHTNVGGSLALLEAMRAADCRRIVFSSTAATYGSPTRCPSARTRPPGRPTPTARRSWPSTTCSPRMRWRTTSRRSASGTSTSPAPPTGSASGTPPRRT